MYVSGKIHVHVIQSFWPNAYTQFMDYMHTNVPKNLVLSQLVFLFSFKSLLLKETCRYTVTDKV